MVKFGIISELGDGDNLGFARVSFDDSDFVSDWLSLPSVGTTSTAQWVPVAVNSQVACMMDDAMEQGVIVAVLWSDKDRPPEWASSDTFGIRFADGAEIIYNHKDHKLAVNAPDTNIEIVCKKMTVSGDLSVGGATDVSGDISTNGKVSAIGDISTTSGDVKTAIVTLGTHIHTTSTGPSGPPTPPAPPTP